MKHPLLRPFTADEEAALLAAIPSHQPGDVVFTALEMGRLYKMLHQSRRDVQMLLEVLRECREVIGGSTFGLAMKIDSVLEMML